MTFFTISSNLNSLISSCEMPKEQGHFGERAARSSSKNAKDRSNSATLRASQGSAHRESTGMGDVSNHMLHCNSEKDSEKDSGYSGELSR